MSAPELLDLRRLTSSWEALEAYVITGDNVAGSGEPVRVTAANITGGMLPMLGVAPAGRLIIPEDDRPGASLTVVLSDGPWRRAFGGQSSILGREAKINGLSATVSITAPVIATRSRG